MGTLKHIRELAKTFSGTLFVCGNAPSVIEQYPQLAGQAVLTVNHFLRWPDLPFPARFHAVADFSQFDATDWDWVTRKGVEFLLAGVEGSEPAPPPWWHVPLLGPATGRGITLDGLRKTPPFATGGTTVVNVGVQVGAYLGFSRICLVGVELSDRGYMDPALPVPIRNGAPKNPRYESYIPAFERACRDLDAWGVELVNCTPVGPIRQTSVPYRDLQEVLGGKPMPAKSEKQRKMMGADLARKRAGKRTRTGMSEHQLEEFARKPRKRKRS